MDSLLTKEELRVVGSLIEKELSTPDYYPMTLNALTNACNQLTNRDPVVTYDEKIILAALDSLKQKKLARVIIGSESRVPKYEETLGQYFGLAVQEMAILCVLILRGEQTAGELRARTNRLYEFANIEEVELTLESLIDRDSDPLIAPLPRQPGMKETRYAHLLAGEVEPATETSNPVQIVQTTEKSERIAVLEAKVEVLQKEIAQLKEAFTEFKKQFD
ncbi:MAG: YceH family protein [Blastocatellia bacterium]|nr:YceH family protein [Blastocatellia bacterium]